jgi:hypothetical protein
LAKFYYRLCNTTDPEERLEDACLWKALHDTFGDKIKLIGDQQEPKEGDVVLGRSRMFNANAGHIYTEHFDYVSDPGFKAGISRRVAYASVLEAEKMIAEIHATGKDAFLKAAKAKQMVARVPVGQDLYSAVGDMIYSLIDRPNSIIVQDFVKMTHERRFVVIGGKIVTCSPVATHLTPLDRDRLREDTGHDVEDLHFETPASRTPDIDGVLAHKMENFVEMVIDASDMEHMIVDVAMLEDGRIEVIEFNPCAPGMFGLFACDPYAIAEACHHFMPEDLTVEKSATEAEHDPYKDLFEDDGEDEEIDFDDFTFRGL